MSAALRRGLLNGCVAALPALVEDFQACLWRRAPCDALLSQGRAVAACRLAPPGEQQHGSRSFSSGGRQPPQQRLTAKHVKEESSCWGVVELLRRRPTGHVPIFVLSTALDHMKLACEGPEPTAQETAAAAEMLRLAAPRLGGMDAWCLVAFIRCAAAFKGALDAEGLAAWSGALACGALLEELTEQGVGNTMLALGTSLEADPSLHPAVDPGLSHALLQRGLWHARAGGLSPRSAANVLFGAVAAGERPSAAEVRELLGAIWGGLGQMHPIPITQTLLALARLADGGEGSQDRLAEDAHAPARAPRPDKHPWRLFYPGSARVDALIERACEAGMDVRNAAQIVHACGRLAHMPRRHAWQQLVEVVRQAPLLSGIHTSAFLMGCARLDCKLEFEVIMACWKVVLRLKPGDHRTVSNVAWALAVLEVCTPTMWAVLVELMSSKDSLPADVSLVMFLQAYQLVQLQLGPAMPTDAGAADGKGGGVACPPQLLQDCIAALHALQFARKDATGHFACTLAQAVRELARGEVVAGQHEVLAPRGEGFVRVDVALPRLHIAVEAEGPMHYLRNGAPGQQTGDTIAHKRLLRGWGWHVVAVPYTVWDEAYTEGAPFASLVTALQQYLEQHTDLVAHMCTRGGTAPAA